MALVEFEYEPVSSVVSLFWGTGYPWYMWKIEKSQSIT